MIALNEYEIIQNTPLAALTLWKFCVAYYNNTEQERGPSIPILMLVLPLAFNKIIAESIYNRRKRIGLHRAISENRTIPVGLQQRMESMESQTFQAINFAFAMDLLEYNHEDAEIFPKKRAFSFKPTNDGVKQIISTAERLGYWFSNISIDQICALLKVRW